MTYCDQCEQEKPGCVSLGEESLCAGCIFVRASVSYPTGLLNRLAEVVAYSWRAQDDGTYDSKAIRQSAYEALEAYAEEMGEDAVPEHVAKLLTDVRAGRGGEEDWRPVGAR